MRHPFTGSREILIVVTALLCGDLALPIPRPVPGSPILAEQRQKRIEERALIFMLKLKENKMKVKYTYCNKEKTHLGMPNHNGFHDFVLRFGDKETASKVLIAARATGNEKMTRAEYAMAVAGIATLYARPDCAESMFEGYDD